MVGTGGPPVPTGDQKEASTCTLFDDLGAGLRALPSKLQ